MSESTYNDIFYQRGEYAVTEGTMSEGERVVFEVIKDPEHPPHGRHLLIGEYPVAGPGGVETSYITRAVWITLGRIYFWSDHGGDPVEGVDWSKCKLVRDEPIPDPVPALQERIAELEERDGNLCRSRDTLRGDLKDAKKAIAELEADKAFWKQRAGELSLMVAMREEPPTPAASKEQ